MIKLKTFKSSLYCQQLLRLIKLFFKLTHYKSLFYKKNTTSPYFLSSSQNRIQNVTQSFQRGRIIHSAISTVQIQTSYETVKNHQKIKPKKQSTFLPYIRLTYPKWSSIQKTKTLKKNNNKSRNLFSFNFRKRKAKKWWKSFNKKYFAIFNCLEDA